MGNIAQPQPESMAEKMPVAYLPAPPAWSLPHRILFRFLFAYLVLYIAPTLANAVPWVSKLGQFYFKAWHALVPWVAIHVFHLSGQPTTYFPTGSGDTTLAYIQNLCYVVFALVATLAWSLADRRRTDYRKLHGWLRVAVRYTLALTLFSYGFAKVFPLQFRFPGFTKLIEPYGDFSPMGVLWNFMGASTAYIIFAGAVEVTGGALLLFRRTTALGAIVSAGALLNIVMLNLCYDVPVKIYSMNLLFQAIFLVAPDLRRLLDLLILNRPVAPGDLGSLLGRRWMRFAAAGVKVLFIGYILFIQINRGWSSYRQVRNPEKPPLYGLYEVEKFTQNGRELPPLTTDATRWRKVVVQFPGFISARAMDDSQRGYSAEYSKGTNTFTLSQGGPKSPKSVFTYTRPDADHVLLEGTLGNDALSIHMRKIDTSKFLLVSRGFHWISELPFNR